MNPTAEKIMDAAELRVRAGGYGAMSFRELANDTGIKSASVHYHFATKEDLGRALVQRYAERLENALKDEADGLDEPRAKLLFFVNYYRQALRLEHSICLCTVLGAEAIELPSSIKTEVDQFFQTGIGWVRNVFQDAGHAEVDVMASVVVSALSGALVIASAANDLNEFEKTAQFVENLL